MNKEPYGPEWQFEFMTTPGKWPHQESCAIKRYLPNHQMEFGTIFKEETGFRIQYENGNSEVVSAEFINVMVKDGWRVD